MPENDFFHVSENKKNNRIFSSEFTLTYIKYISEIRRLKKVYFRRHYFNIKVKIKIPSFMSMKKNFKEDICLN